MPQMTIGPAQTFTAISTQMSNPKSDKHLRFDNVNGLYTGKKASMAKTADTVLGGTRLQTRAQKRVDAANQIKASLNHEYGAGFGDRVFSRVLSDNALNLSQGVKQSHMNAISRAVTNLLALEGKCPTGAQITPDGNLQGASTFLRNADTGSIISTDIEDSARSRIHTSNLVDMGGVHLSTNSQKDLYRMDVNLHDPTGVFNTDHQSDHAVGNALQGFAGSANAAKVLSGVLNQDTLSSLLDGMKRSDGEPIRFTFPNKTAASSVLEHNGTLTQVPFPGQYSSARMDVTQNGHGDFEIDIHWPLHFNGVTAPKKGEIDFLPLHGQNASARATLTTKITIDGQKASQGLLEVGVPLIVKLDYSGKIS